MRCSCPDLWATCCAPLSIITQQPGGERCRGPESSTSPPGPTWLYSMWTRGMKPESSGESNHSRILNTNPSSGHCRETPLGSQLPKAAAARSALLNLSNPICQCRICQHPRLYKVAFFPGVTSQSDPKSESYLQSCRRNLHISYTNNLLKINLAASNWQTKLGQQWSPVKSVFKGFKPTVLAVYFRNTLKSPSESFIQSCKLALFSRISP